jgi:oligoribonuclease
VTADRSDSAGMREKWLVWLDLETTGLDPASNRVLEVACIVTDAALNKRDVFHRVTSAASEVRLADVDPFVRDMHDKNGLWFESARARTDLGGWFHEDFVDGELAAFLESSGGRGCQLAGNTVSFDRAFLCARMPRSAKMLHYRHLDVTGLNELALRLAPEIHAGRPRTSGGAHRAMADVLESIETARYYARALGWLPSAGGE